MRLRLATVVFAAMLVFAAPAYARDPGRWILTGYSSVSNSYWQGVSSPPGARSVFFSGLQQGLYRNGPSLAERAALDPAIPPAVLAAEGYNHVGDISWDRAEGGRVLLPLECFTSGAPGGGNTCGTGSFGVADPATLAFRYYVKLDPTQIAKAMWVESSPDGRLLWTSSGRDLLAYRASEVRPARAAPPRARRCARSGGCAAPCHRAGSPARLSGAAASSSPARSARPTRCGRSTCAAAHAGSSSSCLTSRARRRGCTHMRLMNGELHWLIAPLALKPTFPPTVALLHFTGARGRPGLRLTRAPRPHRRSGRASRSECSHRGRPVAGAVVTLAEARRRTDRGGRVTLTPRLAVPGNYAALARKDGLRGMTKRFRLGFDDLR